MALNVASGLEWQLRKPEHFIDTIVQQSSVIRDFTMVDGVKNKVALPIYDATLVFHNDLCTFDPTSSADIDEKEMTVLDYKWDFQNCKSVLESEYRSMLLRKGSLNAETMDMDFADWVFDYFAKLAGNKLLTLSSSLLTTAVDSGPDAGDINKETISALTTSNIIGEIEQCYLGMSADMASAVYGDADRVFKPAIYLGTVAYQMYQVAVAAQTNSYDISRQISGAVPTYMGLEVIHYPSLGANRIWISAPSNFVFLTDDWNDNQSIQSMYEPRTNTMDIWGQFKAGFDFKKGAEMVTGYTS